MADERHLLTDIRLEAVEPGWRPVYRVAERRRLIPGAPRRRRDLDLVGGRDNLAQAILVRLLTPRGELEPLGHPEYGSRLHTLIGRPGSAANRNLARLYVLEALALEPRIQAVRRVDLVPVPRELGLVSLVVVVEPAGRSELVTVGPFTLEFPS